MHLHSNADDAGYLKRDETPTKPDASIRRLNNALDKVAVLYETNEHLIEDWLDELEIQNNEKNPAYWLLLARLNELTLLCAGNYADSCEFSAAGDLLVNPRQILVHFIDPEQTVIKKRHASLSEQFGRKGQSRKCILQRLANHATIETKRPSLLPHLFKKMQNSGRVSGTYLTLADTRMRQIADTIGFLASWQLSDVAELYRRISGSTPEVGAYIESNLCRFKNDLFFAMGNDVRRIVGNPYNESISRHIFKRRS